MGRMRRAALFDMDRTLLTTHTALLYTRDRRARGEVSVFELLRIVGWILRYSLGVIDAEKVARIALRGYRGRSEASLIETTEEWFERCVPAHVRRGARAAVDHHRAQGDVTVIVTSAAPYAARPLARLLGIEHVVATELMLDASGCLTGDVVDPLCYGRGKVLRTQQLSEQIGFRIEDAAFYTDSITDLPLLEAVKTPVAVWPDRRLSRLARQRGWRVESW
jgi:HAD superfamily hydrolase (TIGR01490 family)